MFLETRGNRGKISLFAGLFHLPDGNQFYTLKGKN